VIYVAQRVQNELWGFLTHYERISKVFVVLVHAGEEA